ncbi:hypothetical protein GMDG_00995 [Pseudogymnoascus destructans 20631-21]|uniref:Uncharacterized protein n=1 Tax=Pseudogymnoascus destructans (strain ATCC MYA-4855 / 20631-21) TaxID=658429 RepID=L8FMR9_PSED2|nr:hypothetical protein GMDG_00995 [Pseudogymnoascus destructans 20631-21]
MSCSSGVTRWPRPLIPRRDGITPTILRRPIVRASEISDQLGAHWEGPGAQPSFNLAPDPAMHFRLLIRAKALWSVVGVTGGFARGLDLHPERALKAGEKDRRRFSWCTYRTNHRSTIHS